MMADDLSNALFDSESTDEEQILQLQPLASFHSPAKKIKNQDFNLCLICNSTTTIKGNLHRWTAKSWETFCCAAQRIQDETFNRLEGFISGRQPLPDITQLWKHPQCYSNYRNPRAVEQKERKRLKDLSPTSATMVSVAKHIIVY